MTAGSQHCCGWQAAWCATWTASEALRSPRFIASLCCAVSRHFCPNEMHSDDEAASQLSAACRRPLLVGAAEEGRCLVCALPLEDLVAFSSLRIYLDTDLKRSDTRAKGLQVAHLSTNA